MHIFSVFRQKIVGILDEMVVDGVLPSGLSFEAITAEPPRDASHGDIATNAAMVIAKRAGKNPRELAQLIANLIKDVENVESVEIAGPGFINIKLSIVVWHEALLRIIGQGSSYGDCEIGNNEKVNIEYVSANPTGPMHIGHARGAVYGDALSSLLSKAGFDVTKEYYINDAGSQIDVLAKSTYLRYKEALGNDIGKIPEGLYPGEYLKVVGKILADEYGDHFLNMAEDEWLPLIRPIAVDKMMDMIRDDLGQLGIVHDVFTSEQDIQNSGVIEDAIKQLDNKGLIYQGVLDPPKGKKTEEWEAREQTLFRSTDFGDDVDRALKKSDGSYTYFAPDIAYHLDKIKRGFNKMVLILGADHTGYIKRMKAAIAALSDNQAELDIKISQLVNFMEDGQPIKMSKRAGTFTTVRDVVNEVGSDVVRYIMLTRKNDVVLDFDLDVVKEQSKDNPIFYLQYASARANSVLRKAVTECPSAAEGIDVVNLDILAILNNPAEIDLIKMMAAWPRIVESAAIANEPHRIAFYLNDLAAEFHALWNKGKDDVILRFIVADDVRLTTARLVMLQAMLNVIASGLAVFNITPVEEM